MRPRVHNQLEERPHGLRAGAAAFPYRRLPDSHGAADHGLLPGMPDPRGPGADEHDAAAAVRRPSWPMRSSNPVPRET